MVSEIDTDKKSKKQKKEEVLAQKLRENLHRRKNQSRKRDQIKNDT